MSKKLEIIFIGILILGFSIPYMQNVSGALMTGDIAFVGYNADFNDDFAIVLLKDVTNEIIFFTDNESDGVGIDLNEGVLKWDTGGATIPAGTVVIFSELDSPDNLFFGASLGTLSVADSGFNLSSSGDGLLAYQGITFNVPSTFLAGIEGLTTAAGSLTGTGLISGLNFIAIAGLTEKDIGEYVGPRSGQLTFSNYLTLVNNPTNWITQGGNQDNAVDTIPPDLPLSTLSFTIFSTSVPVGGEYIGVDIAAIFLAGAQMNASWLIPVVLLVIGLWFALPRRY